MAAMSHFWRIQSVKWPAGQYIACGQSNFACIEAGERWRNISSELIWSDLWWARAVMWTMVSAGDDMHGFNAPKWTTLFIEPQTSIKVNHLQVSRESYPLFTLAQNCIRIMKFPAFLITFCVIGFSYVSATPIGESQLQIVSVETFVLQWQETGNWHIFLTFIINRYRATLACPKLMWKEKLWSQALKAGQRISR